MLMNGLPKFRSVFLMSSHAQKSYLEIDFQDGDWLVLKRKQGLSEV
jgi:tRNA (cytidine/uridine-2'-O-)-methyltransferase